MGKRKKRRAKFVFMCANLVVVETDRVLACTIGRWSLTALFTVSFLFDWRGV